MEGVRFLGAGVMLLGAWQRRLGLFSTGLLITCSAPCWVGASTTRPRSRSCTSTWIEYNLFVLFPFFSDPYNACRWPRPPGAKGVAHGRPVHLHFGQLVAPLSFRDPVMLARQALALDDLSNGRMVLGLGTGYQEREHLMFGYNLGDVPTRYARLAEGLEVITRLLRSDTPVSYAGQFYTLDDAILLPRPQRPGGPPILIGGSGPQRTLPLVARYADIWNGQLMTAIEFAERSALLDELVQAAGRQPEDVRRTMTFVAICGHNRAEIERRLQWTRVHW